LSNVNPKKISIRSSALKRISEERLKKRWCLTQYPTPAYAQEAEMSLKEYEDFLYSTILIDWQKEVANMICLQQIMNRTSEVRLVGNKTDLSLSIKNRTAILSDGTHNMPGGEVFTAPIENSATGKICFDLPAIRYGKEVKNIQLEFNEGEVV
ncbi:unnamed protein product, partial [marine sediment metagenome]